MSPIDPMGNHHSGILTPPPPCQEEEEIKNEKPIRGKTLEEIFDDSNDTSFQNENTGSISYVQKFINFWNSFKTEETQDISPTEESKKAQSAIDFIPSIDVPDRFDPALVNFRLSKSVEPTSKLTDHEIYEGLSRMSETTMHQVMMIVLAAQNELERDSALLNMDDLDRFQKMQKLQQKTLKDIREALLQDETVSGYFNTAQNISIATGILTTLAAGIATWFGYEIPYAQMIQITTAVSSALSIAGKSYFDVRADEDKAKFTDVNHETKVRKGRMESTSDRTERCIQADADIIKQSGKLLKDMIEILKMINQ